MGRCRWTEPRGSRQERPGLEGEACLQLPSIHRSSTTRRSDPMGTMTRYRPTRQPGPTLTAPCRGWSSTATGLVFASASKSTSRQPPSRSRSSGGPPKVIPDGVGWPMVGRSSGGKCGVEQFGGKSHSGKHSSERASWHPGPGARGPTIRLATPRMRTGFQPDRRASASGLLFVYVLPRLPRALLGKVGAAVGPE